MTTIGSDRLLRAALPIVLDALRRRKDEVRARIIRLQAESFLLHEKDRALRIELEKASVAMFVAVWTKDDSVLLAALESVNVGEFVSVWLED